MEQTLAAFIFLPDLLGALIAIHDRHVEVTQNEVIMLFEHQLEPIVAVNCLVDVCDPCLLNYLL